MSKKIFYYKKLTAGTYDNVSRICPICDIENILPHYIKTICFNCKLIYDDFYYLDGNKIEKKDITHYRKMKAFW